MKYNQPFDNADPNAPYVDEDTPGGILGSIPPGAAIEDPQREITYVIDKVLGDGTFASAQDEEDTTQLYQAIIKAASLVRVTSTVNVSPSGVAEPADPFIGDPFDKLSSALAWLKRYRIAPGVLVKIAIAAGTYTETVDLLDLSHPDGLSVVIEGADLIGGGFPTNANFSASASTDEAMLRSRFATRIECANTGILAGRAGLRLMKNILFIGEGAGFGALLGQTEAPILSSFGGDGPAAGSMLNCAFIGFGDGVAVRSGGSLSAFNVASCHNGQFGIVVNNGGYMLGYNIISTRNASHGLHVRDGSTAEISLGGYFDHNTGSGIALYGGRLTTNEFLSAGKHPRIGGVLRHGQRRRSQYGRRFSGLGGGARRFSAVPVRLHQPVRSVPGIGNGRQQQLLSSQHVRHG